SLDGSFNSNWTDYSGSVNSKSTPGAATKVIFSSNTVVGSGPITTTLEQNFSVNDLVFNNETAFGTITGITIASGTGLNTLTIAPAVITDGINVQSGAPAAITISVPIVLG